MVALAPGWARYERPLRQDGIDLRIEALHLPGKVLVGIRRIIAQAGVRHWWLGSVWSEAGLGVHSLSVGGAGARLGHIPLIPLHLDVKMATVAPPPRCVLCLTSNLPQAGGECLTQPDELLRCRERPSCPTA